MTQHQKNFLFTRPWRKHNFQQGQKNFCFTQTPRLAVGPTKLPITLLTGSTALGVRQLQHKADHSHTHSAKDENEWNMPLFPHMLSCCAQGCLLLHNKISNTVNSNKLYCSSNQSARSVMRLNIFTVFFVKYKKNYHFKALCICTELNPAHYKQQANFNLSEKIFYNG